jgi:hypothetical protein
MCIFMWEIEDNQLFEYAVDSRIAISVFCVSAKDAIKSLFGNSPLRSAPLNESTEERAELGLINSGN